MPTSAEPRRNDYLPIAKLCIGPLTEHGQSARRLEAGWVCVACAWELADRALRRKRPRKEAKR
jgi:hypothetical protein